MHWFQNSPRSTSDQSHSPHHCKHNNISMIWTKRKKKQRPIRCKLISISANVNGFITKKNPFLAVASDKDIWNLPQKFERNFLRHWIFLSFWLKDAYQTEVKCVVPKAFSTLPHCLYVCLETILHPTKIHMYAFWPKRNWICNRYNYSRDRMLELKEQIVIWEIWELQK